MLLTHLSSHAVTRTVLFEYDSFLYAARYFSKIYNQTTVLAEGTVKVVKDVNRRVKSTAIFMALILTLSVFTSLAATAAVATLRRP